MFFYEYEELNRDELFREEGREEGRDEGREEGADIMMILYEKLEAIGRLKDFSRCAKDKNYREKLLNEFGLPKLVRGATAG